MMTSEPRVPLDSASVTRDTENLALSAGLTPGKVLGRYKLLMRVASGGMGTVWVAQQVGYSQFRKLVVVKVAHEHLSREPTFESMFLDEARIASAVEHPNVCMVLDLGEDRGLLYLVMEWLGAGSVKQLWAASPERRVPARIAARIICDACAGLHAAHELRDASGASLELIHRDVSPDNLLLANNGQVKVSDFGIARARDQLHDKTVTGELKGKLAYMAPEVFGSTEYDRRIDIYALGCVLYEITVGTKVFTAKTDSGLIYDIIERKFLRPTQLVADFPAPLEAIILRALDSADVRFQTAEGMRVALEEWLAQAGPPCTSLEVGAYVEATLGPKIRERAEALRTAASNVERIEKAATTCSPATLDVEVGPTRILTELKEMTAAARPGRFGAGAVAAFAIVTLLLAAVAFRASSAKKADAALAVAVASSSDAMTAVVVASSSATSSLSTPSSVTSPTSVAPLAAQPETVVVSVEASPGSATASVDGETPRSMPYRATFPRDGRAHTIRVVAPGYRVASEEVVFDRRIDLVVSLIPLSRRAPVPATRLIATAPAASAAAPPTPPATAPPAKRKRSIDSTDPFED